MIDLRPAPGRPWLLSLDSPQAQALAQRFPGSLTLPDGMIAIPHGLFEHKMLRKAGIKVPPPILHTYDWPGREPPFHSQKITAAFLTVNPKAYILSQMGTGKTRAALFAIDWLIANGHAKRALIAAPLSTLQCTWENELFLGFGHLNTSIIYGTEKKRKQLLNNKSWQVGIINHDGLAVVWDALTHGAGSIDIVLVDELAVFRNRNSVRWRAARRVLDRRQWCWGMTGSLTPNLPSDAWSQVRLIDPDRAYMTFRNFRNMVEYKETPSRLAPKKGSERLVHELVQPSIRYTRDQVKELPPLTVVQRDVIMTPLQKKIYDQLKEKMVLMHSLGKVTVMNAGVLVFKLAQVASGAVYDDDGKCLIIGADDRLKVTSEIIEQAEGKVLVFGGYRHNLDMITHRIGKDWTHAVIHGGVAATLRNRIYTDFQHSPDPRVIVAHPRTMAHGLTLTAADTIIWYSVYNSREIFEQANARITRPGQTRPQLIVRLVGSPIERHIYRMLDRRGNFQQQCLELFENHLLEL